jgi:hypothetical protein
MARRADHEASPAGLFPAMQIVHEEHEEHEEMQENTKESVVCLRAVASSRLYSGLWANRPRSVSRRYPNTNNLITWKPDNLPF